MSDDSFSTIPISQRDDDEWGSTQLLLQEEEKTVFPDEYVCLSSFENSNLAQQVERFVKLKTPYIIVKEINQMLNKTIVAVITDGKCKNGSKIRFFSQTNA